jgi:hypothetical protein
MELQYWDSSITNTLTKVRSWNSSVGKAMDLGAGRPGFDTQYAKIYFTSLASRPALGSTQPPTQCVPGELLPGVKRPESEANLHVTSPPRYVFME